MGHEYDKIIKENIEAIIMPLAHKLFNIRPKAVEEISDDLQLTIERKPDFTRRITDFNDQQYILHLEFQVSDESRMVVRMQTYRALLQEIHLLPVKQFVIYLGLKSPLMKISIADYIQGDENNFQFNLIDIHQYDYDNLVASEIPEEIILAILGDFKNESTTQAVAKILDRLATISVDKSKLQRYIHQLMVMAKLRNLQEETIKQIEKMPIEFDIESDIIYQKGKAEGEAKGELKGKKAIINEMLKDGALSLEKIATYAKVSVNEVLEIQKEIKSKK